MLHFANTKGLIDETPVAFRRPPQGLHIGLSLRHGWRLVLGCFVLGVAAAAAVVATSEPSYVASARVLFDPGAGDTGRQSAQRDLQQYAVDSAQLESQIQLLKSEQISRTVIDAHELEKDPEFARSHISLRARALALLGMEGPRRSDGYNIVSDEFDDHLDVRRLGQSYVLQVAFRSTNPDKAARLTNAVIAAYIGRQIAARIDNARRTSRFERPIRELEADGEAAARAVKTGVIDTLGFPVADGRLISGALVPSGPSTPRTGLIMMLGALLGLLGGSAWAVARHAWRRPVFSGEQVERELGLHYLGEMRRLRATPLPSRDAGEAEAIASPGLMSEEPSLAARGQLRKIRTSVEMNVDRGQAQCVGVTSFRPGEGKTLTAYGLALAFAASGSRTLLIDADPLQPTLSRRLQPHLRENPSGGLAQALAGESISSVIGASDVRNLSFMRIGEGCGTDGFSDRLDNVHAKNLFRQLRERYDRIVVDLSDFSGLPDAWAFGSLIDAYVIVIAKGRTGQADVAQMAAALQRCEARIAGVVLNEGAG